MSKSEKETKEKETKDKETKDKYTKYRFSFANYKRQYAQNYFKIRIPITSKDTTVL
ncbi:MAG: hypothetical protein MAG458_01133 [Nitrosopumilus sp.]|nr:hypothetical protein [Nitrosopumilus sp.]